MDEPNSTENSNVGAMTHTAESGFVDIKPLEPLSQFSPKDFGFYLLILLGILLTCWIVYKIKNAKGSKKVEKKEISAPVLFKNRIDSIEPDKIDFRELCERLTFALKSLCSSVFKEDFISLTPYYFKIRIIKLIPQFFEFSKEKTEECVLSMCRLLKKLEGGEYGDQLTIDQLKNLKSSMFEESKALGLTLIELMDQEVKNKKLYNKKNLRK